MAADLPCSNSPDRQPFQAERLRWRGLGKGELQPGQRLQAPDTFFSRLGRSGRPAARHDADEPPLPPCNGVQDPGDGRHQLEVGEHRLPLPRAQRFSGRRGRTGFLGATRKDRGIQPGGTKGHV